PAQDMEAVHVAADATGGDIAVTGLGLRLPGARDADQYWENLLAGKTFLHQVSDRRSSLSGTNDWNDVIDELEGIDNFDHEVFGISRETAAVMDPQQRVLLQTALHCCEEADAVVHNGVPRNIGVYIGASGNTYAELVGHTIQDAGLSAIPQTALA